MAIFHPSGDRMQQYRMTAGFYSTGDSVALRLSAEQFRQFLQIQAVGRISPSLLHLFSPSGVIGEGETFTERQKVVRRILARRDAIGARTGTLPESYTLIRRDRER